MVIKRNAMFRKPSNNKIIHSFPCHDIHYIFTSTICINKINVDKTFTLIP